MPKLISNHSVTALGSDNALVRLVNAPAKRDERALLPTLALRASFGDAAFDAFVSYNSSPIRKDRMDFPNLTAKYKSVYEDSKALSLLGVGSGNFATNEAGLCTGCELLKESKTKCVKSRHAPNRSFIRPVFCNVFVLGLFYMMAFLATVIGFGWMLHILTWGNAVKVPSESDNLTAIAGSQSAIPSIQGDTDVVQCQSKFDEDEAN
ncbi:hypothetical protein TSMEX_004394, partial [Taenia solium]